LDRFHPYHRFLYLIFILTLVWSCSTPTPDENDPDDPVLPDPPASAAIIIDHLCTDLSLVPDAYIQSARDQLRIGYSHTSHGSQLVTGLTALSQGPVISGQILPRAASPIAFTSSGWGLDPGVFLNDYWGNAGGADDLGSNGNLGWKTATLNMLGDTRNDRNLIIWSWCGGVSDNSSAGIQAYLGAMADLERQFPSIRFVYMTGHLDGSGSGGNLHQRNEEIRTHCRQNGKILFDFADIERYDPSGRDFLSSNADDGCYYSGGNWAEEWVSAHPEHALSRRVAECDECAHSHRLNCILKGQAFWWMLARLAGWPGPNG
jgi:hypothetical protein